MSIIFRGSYIPATQIAVGDLELALLGGAIWLSLNVPWPPSALDRVQVTEHEGRRHARVVLRDESCGLTRIWGLDPDTARPVHPIQETAP